MTDTQRHVPLGKAAKLVKVSRPTIYRYAAEGKLTITEGVGGIKLVDLAELARVFPDFKPETADTETVTDSETVSKRHLYQSQSIENKAKSMAESQVLKVELEAAKKEAGFYKDEVERLRLRETDLLELVKSNTRLLEHKPDPKPPSSTAMVLVAILLALVAVIAAKALGFL